MAFNLSAMVILFFAMLLHTLFCSVYIIGRTSPLGSGDLDGGLGSKNPSLVFSGGGVEGGFG